MEADTPRIEEYLESIYKLQQEQHPVSTSRLAEHLKLSPPSVSEMVKKLVNKGLINQTGKGVCLTEEGAGWPKKSYEDTAFLSACLPISWALNGTRYMRKRAGLSTQ